MPQTIEFPEHATDVKMTTTGRAITRPDATSVRTGLDLLTYWYAEELIGNRSDIDDSLSHARQLREQAEHRKG